MRTEQPVVSQEVFEEDYIAVEDEMEETTWMVVSHDRELEGERTDPDRDLPAGGA